MAWYSYTLAVPVDLNEAQTVAASSDLTGLYQPEVPFVHTSSRNGVMLGLLSQIYDIYQPQRKPYLLQDFVKLEGQEIQRSCQDITQLLARIEQEPSLVSEATKTPYTPYITLQTEGFEPVAAEWVYPSQAVIQDGFFYEYPPAQVSKALFKAQVSSYPDLAHDPDGESLEYLFCFLKSHLWLLQQIDPKQQVLFYGELNN